MICRLSYKRITFIKNDSIFLNSHKFRTIMGQIELEGMEFYAYHGHFESERKTGNKFLVDLIIKYDTIKTAMSDDLNDALNYQEVYETVKVEMNKNSNLLEHLAHRILKQLYHSFAGIESATIKISKLNPPMGGQIEKVSISMTL